MLLLLPSPLDGDAHAHAAALPPARALLRLTRGDHLGSEASLLGNGNADDLSAGNKFDLQSILLAALFVFFVLSTAIGNLFVILAILLERNLRTVGNHLVLSLAIADFLVAALVMPFASIYHFNNHTWTLGVLACEIWTSADVFSCTGELIFKQHLKNSNTSNDNTNTRAFQLHSLDFAPASHCN